LTAAAALATAKQSEVVAWLASVSPGARVTCAIVAVRDHDVYVGVTLGLAPLFFPSTPTPLLLVQGAACAAATVAVLAFADWTNHRSKYTSELRLSLLIPSATQRGKAALRRVADSVKSKVRSTVAEKVVSGTVGYAAKSVVRRAVGGGKSGK
jgi:hypothetical protein